MNSSGKLSALIIAFGIEILCTQIIFIYIPLFLIFSGEDEFTASVFRAVAYIGPVLLGYYIGKIVDIFEKRRLGFSIAIVLAAASALYGLLKANQSLHETFLFLVLLSIGTYFLNNLRTSVLPSVVNSSKLSSVNSLLLIVENVALIAAPIISSLLLSFNSPEIGFIFISILFFISSLLYFFSLPTIPAASNNGNSNSFVENFKILLKNKTLLHLVFAVMGNNAFTGVYLLYIMIYALDTKLFASTEVPFILIAFAVGAIFSGVTASKAITMFGNQVLAIICCFLMAISGAIPLLMSIKSVFFISAFMVGFFESYVVVAVWTLRQKLVPTAVLGKVTGITSALFKVSMVMAIPLAGLLSSWRGSGFAILFGVFIVFLGIMPLVVHLISLNIKSRTSVSTSID